MFYGYYKTIKYKAIINNCSYIFTNGLNSAVVTANKLYNLDGNKSFKLKDILTITQKDIYHKIGWRYYEGASSHLDYRDGSYSLKDFTYVWPEVFMRITLNVDRRVISYMIDCKKIKQSTHKELRELCIEKWGDKRIEKDLSF